jgi:hypothetical protein
VSTPTTRRRTTACAVAALAAGLGALVAAPAHAGGLAATTVTIEADGTDLSGTVESSQVVCMDDRKVIVLKQKGAKGGGDDKRVATDTADLSGDVGVWSTGNTGLEGRFYAKVRKTEFCKADTSPTIRVSRDD